MTSKLPRDKEITFLDWTIKLLIVIAAFGFGALIFYNIFWR
jgi:hypothetical protein